MELVDSEMGDIFKVPKLIPPFLKHQRHHSRLSEDWSFADDFYDDFAYCTKVNLSCATPLEAEFNAFRTKRLSTSTPFLTHPSTCDSDKKKCQPNSLNSTTKDSGRWSLESCDFDFIKCELPLPRLSLESQFDEVAEIETDSAYESSFGSQGTLSDYFSQASSLDLTGSSTSADFDATPHSKSIGDITALLSKFTPTESDRLIGRRMGRDFVDIIAELSSRNVSSVLSLVLVNVDKQDLCSMCCVSKEWKNVCDNDKAARLRIDEWKSEVRLHIVELQKVSILGKKKNLL